MKQYTATANDDGVRLSRFVQSVTRDFPTSLLYKSFRNKRVKVNGKKAVPEYRIQAGDLIELYINDEFFESPSEENVYLTITTPRLKIVYEDENIMLLDKPAGMLAHADEHEKVNTLVNHMLAYLYQKREWRPREENAFTPALCNRIDRNTGGIVIAAKNAEALRILNDKIRDREIDKAYLCVVCGRPRPAEGRLEGYLFKDAVKNQVYVTKKPQPGAKSAATEYRTLQSRKGLSLVECRLLTGRTHQIRAQMAAAGCPLLGDGKYGRERINRTYGETGQMLYSYKLTFTLPTDAGILEYLRGKTFQVQQVAFAEKYFPGFQIP